jgi:HD-GYP domain-containing protein (c-di-GMP phosphodiesterase class II)
VAIGIDTDPGLNPAVQQLLEEAENSPPRRLSGRERVVEWATAIAFLAAATAMAVLMPAEGSFDPWLAVALVGGYALASRIRFSDGAGYTVPTQLIFVPMLFLLPTTLAPLLVAAGTLAGNLPDYVRRRTHPDRAILSLGDAWHAVPPALVLVAAGAEAPVPADWPIFVAALAAQFAGDFVASTTREWLAMGVPPGIQPRLLAWVYMVDLLLSPIGFLAALASEQRFAFLLVLPLAALLWVFSRERNAHLRQAMELSRAYHGTALLLGDIVEADHEYTGTHSQGVVSLALEVADELDMDARERRNVELGALLHDVGKIAIPNEIINKPGPLSPQEWTVVKTHTVEGQRMLDRVGGMLCEIGHVVRASHEHWDGSGYPDGLAGKRIPREARVVSCCDAFSAMTTTRSYRSAMPVAAALAELQAHAGTQFDPTVVAAVAAVVQRPQVAAPARSNTRGEPDGVPVAV